jgi:hypothetical protein
MVETDLDLPSGLPVSENLCSSIIKLNITDIQNNIFYLLWKRRSDWQHAAYSMQHTACSVQHAAYSMQHTACSVQHTAYNIQHAAYSCNIQHATYSMQHTACSIQHAAYSIQHAAYSMQHTAYSIHTVINP